MQTEKSEKKIKKVVSQQKNEIKNESAEYIEEL